MAFVETGTQRTLNLIVKKTGNDGSLINPYLTLDGKSAFGSYAEITSDEMQKLSNEDFIDRVNSWKLYLQAEYAESDPNLWGDISSSFKYVNGLIVRLISTEVDKQYKITIYPEIAQELISATFIDPWDSHRFNLTIPSGEHSSVTVDLDPDSTSMDIDIEQSSEFELTSLEFGEYMHYVAYADIAQPLYPRFELV